MLFKVGRVKVCIWLPTKKSYTCNKPRVEHELPWAYGHVSVMGCLIDCVNKILNVTFCKCNIVGFTGSGKDFLTRIREHDPGFMIILFSVHND